MVLIILRMFKLESTYYLINPSAPAHYGFIVGFVAE